jgi:hypothetical protein
MAANERSCGKVACGILVALAVPFGAFACSLSEAGAEGCFGVAGEALMNATTEERYLGLSDRARAAIVSIVNSSGSREALCTGTLVNREWVLTAGHCSAIEGAEVVVSLESGATPTRLPVVGRSRHSELDLALLRVSSNDVLPAMAPLRREKDVGLLPNDLVELAGYGVTETGSTHELRFLVEPIVEVDTESLIVSGAGASGACLGDSGGPLLVRDREGRVVVAGVLSSGSPSCLGEDRYVRVDTVTDWITEVAGPTGDESVDCGGIDTRGRCLYGNALYCSGATLVCQTCDGDRRCGWDETAQGFRCVPPSEDPCDGIDSLGACHLGAPAFCNDGRLERSVCACGDVCRVHGASGEPTCATAGP